MALHHFGDMAVQICSDILIVTKVVTVRDTVDDIAVGVIIAPSLLVRSMSTIHGLTPLVNS